MEVKSKDPKFNHSFRRSQRFAAHENCGPAAWTPRAERLGEGLSAMLLHTDTSILLNTTVYSVSCQQHTRGAAALSLVNRELWQRSHLFRAGTSRSTSFVLGV